MLDLDSPLPCRECGRPSVWTRHDDLDDPPLFISRCACGVEWLDLDEIPTYANSGDMVIRALVARVRELEAALQTAHADYEEVEQTRRDLHRVMHLQSRELNESANECCELRATLANERGKGEGPSEGWAFDGDECTVGPRRWTNAGWFVYRRCDGWDRWDAGPSGHGHIPHRPDRTCCGWWAIQPQGGAMMTNVYFSAREAMRAADTARGAT